MMLSAAVSSSVVVQVHFASSRPLGDCWLGEDSCGEEAERKNQSFITERTGYPIVSFPSLGTLSLPHTQLPQLTREYYQADSSLCMSASIFLPCLGLELCLDFATVLWHIFVIFFLRFPLAQTVLFFCAVHHGVWDGLSVVSLQCIMK
jgi:hypothetical protein